MKCWLINKTFVSLATLQPGRHIYIVRRDGNYKATLISTFLAWCLCFATFFDNKTLFKVKEHSQLVHSILKATKENPNLYIFVLQFLPLINIQLRLKTKL